jgi:hypothetical protein
MISFLLFEREELLSDWIKFRVSEKGWWGYAYTETAYAAPEDKESTGKTESPSAETVVANSTPATVPTGVVDTGSGASDQHNAASSASPGRSSLLGGNCDRLWAVAPAL